MKPFYITAILLLLRPLAMVAQNQTTVVPSSNCNFTYNFNTTDEGFSSPSIYSDANDLGLYWDGTQLLESSGLVIPRTASTISGIYFNTESARSTVGFDYSVPAGTEYRIRIISGLTNPPLEILATTATGPVWTAFPATSGSLCLELQDADLILNAQIRYEISFRTSLPGNISIDNFRRATFNAPLPVVFLGFIARDNADGSIRLLWNVAEEINVKGYEVETSADGIHFISTAFVPATGKDNYSYTYTTPIKKDIYFRVRNVDFDNQYKYTGVIRIKSSNPVSTLKAYPVPTGNYVYIEHPKTMRRTLMTLVSSEGRIVRQVNTAPGSYQTYIELANLQRGLYFVRYEDENGIQKSIKLVKTE